MQMSHDQKVTAFLMGRCGTRCIAAAFLDFFMSVSVSDTMPRATCGYTRARRRAAGAAERSKTAARACDLMSAGADFWGRRLGSDLRFQIESTEV